MHVLIPCKGLAAGKSRLAGCLGAAARRRFCDRLLRFTLTQAVAVAPPANIRLVTGDPAAAEVAGQFCVAGLPDPGGGLNAALEYGRMTLLSQVPRMDALLIWPIDLPFASPDAIGAMTARPGDVVITPDTDGSGTNMLLLRRRALPILPFAYGPDSCARHIEIARREQLAITRCEDRRLAFDVDEPRQYAQWLASCAQPDEQPKRNDETAGESLGAPATRPHSGR